MDCEASARDLLERMLLDTSAEPTALPLSLLRSITNNFSDDQQIGSGGFAVVYEGILHEGDWSVNYNCIDLLLSLYTCTQAPRAPNQLP